MSISGLLVLLANLAILVIVTTLRNNNFELPNNAEPATENMRGNIEVDICGNTASLFCKRRQKKRKDHV